MNKTKKVTNFIILGIIVSIISLCSCVSVFGIANANMGVASESYDIFEVKVSDISDLYFEDESFEILKNPIVDEQKTISYGLLAKKVNTYSQFQFNVENKGNVSSVVDIVDITGFEEYKDYIDVTLEVLSVGDKIEAGTMVPVKVKITYKNPLVNELGEQQNIELCNLKINLGFKKE